MSNQSDPLDKRNLIEVDASTVGKYAGLFTPASLYNKLVRYIKASEAKIIDLTQADIRVLYSANNSQGLLVTRALGESKFNFVTDIILILNHQGGTEGLNYLGVYSDNGFGQFAAFESQMGFINSGIMVLKDQTQMQGLLQNSNNNIYLQSEKDLSDFIGTGKLIFKHKVIDV
jgi:hypothetical protein